MTDLIFGGGETFTALVFSLTALAMVGLSLLFGRIQAATRLRGAKLDVINESHRAEVGSGRGHAAGFGSAASSSPSAGGGLAAWETQLRDANHSLFMALMECCSIVTEAAKGTPEANSDAVTLAAKLLQSGHATMSNREIADHAYNLAGELRPFSGPAMTAVRRVLTQLALAEKWGASLR